jgi:hypothetical protein
MQQVRQVLGAAAQVQWMPASGVLFPNARPGTGRRAGIGGSALSWRRQRARRRQAAAAPPPESCPTLPFATYASSPLLNVNLGLRRVMLAVRTSLMQQTN